MRKYLVVPLLCAALASAGCYKVTYSNPTLPPNGVEHEGNGHFFLWGLIGSKTIAVYELCPAGVSQIQTKRTFGNLFFYVITLGLYAPRHWEVECGGTK
jgi:hypothetical protein